MRKTINVIGLIFLVCFVSLASLANNPNFNAIQNQGGQVQVQLTHQATHIFSMGFFNQAGSQYLSTEGNDTVILHSIPTNTYLGAYSFTDDENNTPPLDWISASALVEDIYAEHSKVVRFEANVSGALIYQEIAPEGAGIIEFWAYFPTITSGSLEFITGNIANVKEHIGIEFYHGATDKFFSVWNGSNLVNFGLQLEQWTHIRVAFTDGSGGQTWELWVNQTYIGAYDYKVVSAYATDFIKFIDAKPVYLDAIDYNWTEGYYLNRNMDTSPLYEATGSYISPIVDLGSDAPFCSDVRMVYDEPSDSALDASIAFSADNVSWSGFSDFPLGNYSMNALIARYFQYYLNFTVSSDNLTTPSFTLLEIDWNETVLNEIPQIGDISVTFDNETLEATISVYVTDPDNDTLNVMLCLPLGTILQTILDQLNGTTVVFEAINCTYSTEYEYYINVTDSEDSVQSSTFGFTTGAEPPETPVLDIYLVLTIVLAFLGAFVMGGIILHKGTIDSETREQPKQRRTRFLTLLLSFLSMGCGGRSTYSPSSCLVETGAKNKTSRVV